MADDFASRVAAWLHDIGYAEPLKRFSFRPLDDAFYLLETTPSTCWRKPDLGTRGRTNPPRPPCAQRLVRCSPRHCCPGRNALGARPAPHDDS
jgi:hypothetical protein